MITLQSSLYTINLDQFLKESSSTTSVPSLRPSHSRALSTPSPYRPSGERQPLIRRHSHDQYEAENEGADPSAPTTGGTVLGIHNLAIVIPQFIVSLNSYIRGPYSWPIYICLRLLWSRVQSSGLLMVTVQLILDARHI